MCNNSSVSLHGYKIKAKGIKQNSEQIVAVLAGHLHFANNTEITEGVMQYVSTQGDLGNINRYEIGE